MSGHHLLAVMRQGSEASLAKGMSLVQNREHCAILAPIQRGILRSRRAVLKAAAARQEQLEHLMLGGTVLPALQGIRLTKQEAQEALQSNASLIGETLTRLDGMVQFQCSISWDRAQVPTGVQAWLFDHTGLGRNACPAQALALYAADMLSAVTSDAVSLPLRDRLAFNAVLLVEAAKVEALDSALHQIDQLWTEGLNLRLVGPSPAMSFASLRALRIKRKELLDALHGLGLEKGASDDAIRAARRRRLMSDGEARQETVLRQADICQFAARAGWPEQPLIRFGLWSEPGAAPQSQMRGAA